MATKEQIIIELEHLPEPLLNEVLNFVLSLKLRELTSEGSEAYNAYLASEKKWEGVYRRLADS